MTKNKVFFTTDIDEVKNTYENILREANAPIEQLDDMEGYAIFSELSIVETNRMLQEMYKLAMEYPDSDIRLVLYSSDWTETYFLENKEGTIFTISEEYRNNISMSDIIHAKTAASFWLSEGVVVMP